MEAATNNMPKGSGRPTDDFSYFCEGDTEPTLNKPICVLIASKKDHIIYLDDKHSVQWSTTEAYDERADADQHKNIGIIASRIGHLETLSVQLRDNDPKQVEPFERLLGEAMARMIGDEDYNAAKECIESAESLLYARSGDLARGWYLEALMLVTGVMIAAASVFWLAREMVLPIIGVNAFDVVLGTLIGGVGAFAAVLTQLGALKIDVLAGRRIHWWEGSTRVIGGAAGALLMALAVKANIVLGDITKAADYPLAVLLAVCFAAGWSEKLVLRLIGHFEAAPPAGTRDEK